jgi:hypothetical protein
MLLLFWPFLLFLPGLLVDVLQILNDWSRVTATLEKSMNCRPGLILKIDRTVVPGAEISAFKRPKSIPKEIARELWPLRQSRRSGGPAGPRSGRRGFFDTRARLHTEHRRAQLPGSVPLRRLQVRYRLAACARFPRRIRQTSPNCNLRRAYPRRA